jgi:2-methylcitrate dehydratase PrpD
VTETITVQLVNFLLDDAPSISGDARQAARRLLADVLGVTMAGASTAEGQIMLASVADRGPAGPCGVAMFGPRLYEPTEDDLHDLALQDVMDRIELLEDPALTGVFPQRWSDRVRAQWADGTFDLEQVDVPKDDPENPMTDHELDEKFVRLTA